MSLTRAYATIDLTALQHNFAVIKKQFPEKKWLLMVKADAYGHGLLPVAQALTDADAFGVACYEEALVLREGGVQNEIVVMTGFIDADDLRALNAMGVTVMVHQPHHVALLETVELPKPQRVRVKVDTGMGRLGFFAEDVASVVARLTRCAAVVLDELVLATHLPDCENEVAVTAQQLADFHARFDGMGVMMSCENSRALILHRTLAEKSTWARPGLLLYGIVPSSLQAHCDLPLKSVMALYARLISIKTLPTGWTVGYGREFTCQQPTKVGIVALGYGDGYPQSAGAHAQVLCAGKLCPVIGRVSMDMLAVDITQADADVGDVVNLWGPALPANDVAESIGCSVYELLSRLTKRLLRNYEMQEETHA